MLSVVLWTVLMLIAAGTEADTHSLVPPDGSRSNIYISEMANLQQLDAMIAERLFNATRAQLQELLWRHAAACFNFAGKLGRANAEARKVLLLEGHESAVSAYNTNDKNFEIVKWTALLSGEVIDLLDDDAGLQECVNFKEYVSRRLAIEPSDFTLLHMRGRFSYSMAKLSWGERNSVESFFSGPVASFDDALADFVAVDRQTRGTWLENSLYMAKCYVGKKDKQTAVSCLRTAERYNPTDDNEWELMEKVVELLEKYSNGSGRKKEVERYIKDQKKAPKVTGDWMKQNASSSMATKTKESGKWWKWGKELHDALDDL